MLLYKSGKVDGGRLSCVKCVAPYNFSVHTTYGVGGNANVAYMPSTLLQAKAVYDSVTKQKVPYVVIGNGSNLLVSDAGYKGVVISTSKLRGIIRTEENTLFCLAGTKISDLLKYCRKHRLSGLEYLAGIPATVGGAAYMNAGVCGVALGDNIVSVRLYNGKTVILNKNQCNFGYRSSTMRDINALILGVTLRVNGSDDQTIEDRLSYYRERRLHLPKGKSCGCVFKNPAGFSAGYLIEACGFKGKRIGGAVVSEKHANFILNCGASADDIKRLITKVKYSVAEKFGFYLQEEVVYIGEFNDTDC